MKEEKRLNKTLTEEEREKIVLNTWETNLKEGKRFFIFDCNKGVLDKEFNAKLAEFFQDAVKNYKINEMKLFKVILRVNNNKSLPERVEYFRCKSKEILKDSMLSACSSSMSEYYGYTDVHITKTEIKNFPEIVQVEISVKTGK